MLRNAIQCIQTAHFNFQVQGIGMWEISIDRIDAQDYQHNALVHGQQCKNFTYKFYFSFRILDVETHVLKVFHACTPAVLRSAQTCQDCRAGHHLQRYSEIQVRDSLGNYSPGFRSSSHYLRDGPGSEDSGGSDLERLLTGCLLVFFGL